MLVPLHEHGMEHPIEIGSHPDTGSGDPSFATAEKGKAHFEAISAAIADVLVGLSNAKKGQLPYL